MPNFLDLVAQRSDLQAKTWLIVGKGPSAENIEKFNTGSYFKIGINHVVENCNLDALHLMDLDVAETLPDSLLDGITFLVMPFHPHVSYKVPGLSGTFHKAGDRNINELCKDIPLLRKAKGMSKLYTYHASSSKKAPSRHKIVSVGSFSAATLVNLLSDAGIRQIKSLGIDGGNLYAQRFKHLEDQTRLDAGQESYDQQFQEIATAKFHKGFSYRPLMDDNEIKVYVGSQKEQRLAFEVLRYSIQKRCHRDVAVMDLSDEIENKIPDYKEITSGLTQNTPFSLQRFAIPELEDRRGKAIYVDSDMQVFEDITKLWQTDLDHQSFLSANARNESKRPAQLSVLLIDCETAQWDIREISENLRSNQISYADLFNQGAGLGPFERGLPYTWNDLEHYAKAETQLLHFTNMAMQPWLNWRNDLARLWCEELLAAIKDGQLRLEEVIKQINKGWIRPSLAFQIENHIADPLLLPRAIQKQDDTNFVPPHLYLKARSFQIATGFGEEKPSHSKILFKKLYARVRYFLIVTKVYWLLSRANRVIKKIRVALGTGLAHKK